MRTSSAVFAFVVSGILCLSLAAQAADPLPRAKPEEVGMLSERLALINKAINAEVASGQLPGAVLAIARRGKLVYFEAFGYRDRASGAPMTTDAIFSIASMTKPMVAVAAHRTGRADFPHPALRLDSSCVIRPCGPCQRI